MILSTGTLHHRSGSSFDISRMQWSSIRRNVLLPLPPSTIL